MEIMGLLAAVGVLLGAPALRLFVEYFILHHAIRLRGPEEATHIYIEGNRRSASHVLNEYYATTK